MLELCAGIVLGMILLWIYKNKFYNIYESTQSLNEYLLMHYGTDDLFENKVVQGIDIPNALNFPVNTAQKCIQIVKEYGKNTRCLDVGCAVGRSTFELSTYFYAVVGLDYSASFINNALQLKTRGHLPYIIKMEGDIYKEAIAKVPRGIHRHNADFIVGDACNLDPKLGKFDCIFASNLLCRLPNPFKFLLSLPNFLNADGIVILISPYTWLPQYTSKSKWLGGYYHQNRTISSESNIKQIMYTLGFQLLVQENIPFLIRETARKYQWTISDLIAFKLN